MTRKLVISKEPEDLSKFLKEEEKENLNISDLIDAINCLLEKKELERPIKTKITKKEISVTERITRIRNILNGKKQVNFKDLFEYSTKEEIIVSFLSILEMLKKDEITIKQDNNFNNIVICLKEGV